MPEMNQGYTQIEICVEHMTVNHCVAGQGHINHECRVHSLHGFSAFFIIMEGFLSKLTNFKETSLYAVCLLIDQSS